MDLLVYNRGTILLQRFVPRKLGIVRMALYLIDESIIVSIIFYLPTSRALVLLPCLEVFCGWLSPTRSSEFKVGERLVVCDWDNKRLITSLRIFYKI